MGATGLLARYPLGQTQAVLRNPPGFGPVPLRTNQARPKESTGLLARYPLGQGLRVEESALRLCDFQDRAAVGGV